IFFLMAISVPSGAPDAVKGPPEARKHLVPESIPVACGGGRVVLVAVAFNAEGEGAGLGGVSYADVDTEAGGSDLGLNDVAPGLYCPDHGLFERRVGHEACHGGLCAECGDASACEVEVRAQGFDVLVQRGRDVACVHGCDDLDALP